MKFSTLSIKKLGVVLLSGILALGCNKDVDQFPEEQVNPSSLSSLTDTLASPAMSAKFSLYNALVTKAGLTKTLGDSSGSFTMFVPNNAAMKTFITAASQGAIPANAPETAFLAFIQGNSLTPMQATQIVSYYSAPGLISYNNLSTQFPNFQYPSLLNPRPDLSALFRMTLFPSNANGDFVNNIPIITKNIKAGNGLIQEMAAFSLPPSQMLWDRINEDANLSYLKAAIIRADSGVVLADTSLRGYLANPGANFTVFAPTDAAFKATLYQLAYPMVYNKILQTALDAHYPLETAQAVANGQAPGQTNLLVGTPDIFKNPDLFGFLTATLVKGVVVYHMLLNRAFTNNFPTTETGYPSLLSKGLPGAPFIGLKASFAGPMVIAATVKGNINPTAANITLNPYPNGTSDQHYVNGVIHKIDQVLLPLSF